MIANHATFMCSDRVPTFPQKKLTAVLTPHHRALPTANPTTAKRDVLRGLKAEERLLHTAEGSSALSIAMKARSDARHARQCASE